MWFSLASLFPYWTFVFGPVIFLTPLASNVFLRVDCKCNRTVNPGCYEHTTPLHLGQQQRTLLCSQIRRLTVRWVGILTARFNCSYPIIIPFENTLVYYEIQKQTFKSRCYNFIAVTTRWSHFESNWHASFNHECYPLHHKWTEKCMEWRHWTAVYNHTYTDQCVFVKSITLILVKVERLACSFIS